MNKKNINTKEMIKDLIQLINIPSVYSKEAKEGAPFGENVQRGLQWVLELGKEFGFKTKNYNGYAGEINVGHGEFIIGVLCHVDVVEAGDHWNTDPFNAVIKEGKVFGRGSSDNKGPLIAALYAMKQLKEEGTLQADNVTIRMIIGTNEEEAWEGINHYIKVANKLPQISIVPDAFFPLIFCEKGLYDFNILYQANKNQKAPVQLVKLVGGDSRNIVPSSATCVLQCYNHVKYEQQLRQRCKELDYKNKISLDDEQNIVLTILGKSAHAMSPEKGVNALSQLIKVLSTLENDFSHYEFVKNYNCCIGNDYTGAQSGFDCSDLDSGMLTFNVGKVELQKNTISLQANIRYPASKNFKIIQEQVTKSLEQGNFTTKFVDHLKPVYFEKNSKVVSTLMNVYQTITGDFKSKPLSMGGATYARAIPNAVAFGAIFPEEIEVAHEANECMAISSIEKTKDILYAALKELQNIQ